MKRIPVCLLGGLLVLGGCSSHSDRSSSLSSQSSVSSVSVAKADLVPVLDQNTLNSILSNAGWYVEVGQPGSTSIFGDSTPTNLTMGQYSTEQGEKMGIVCAWFADEEAAGKAFAYLLPKEESAYELSKEGEHIQEVWIAMPETSWLIRQQGKCIYAAFTNSVTTKKFLMDQFSVLKP